MASRDLDEPPHTSFNMLPEALLAKPLECMAPFWRMRARLTCARLRSAADKLLTRVVCSPEDAYPFTALAALPVRFPAAAELELWSYSYTQRSRTGAELEQVLLPHLQALPDGALRQITRLTGQAWFGLTPRLLAQLGRVCPMLRRIEPDVAHLVTGRGTVTAAADQAGCAGEAAQQVAASQSGAACDASPYLASLESLVFSTYDEGYSAADVEADAAALVRLTSLRRLDLGGETGREYLVGPRALASATVTSLTLNFLFELPHLQLSTFPALRALSMQCVGSQVDALKGPWPAPLSALTRLEIDAWCVICPSAKCLQRLVLH